MEYHRVDDGGSYSSCGGCCCGGDNDPSFALKRANWFYVGKFIGFGIWCFILYNTGSSWLGKIIKTVFTNDTMIEISLVCRTTAALAIWYAIHSIITICNKNLQDSCQFMLHISFLWVHSLILLALYIAFWFIPDGFFNAYVYICYVGSGIYLFLQILFLIDFFHDLNKKLIDGDHTTIMLIITIILGVGSLVGFGLEYWLFAKGSSKSGNIALITINMLLVIAAFGASLVMERGSIFTASLVAAYVAYLTFSGLSCENGISGDSGSSTSIVFSIIASIFTLVWAGYSAMSSSGQFASACTCPCCENEDDEEPIFSLSFFHFMFAMASIYLTMIVTHWANPDDQRNVSWAVDRGTIPKWVNMAASWLTLVFYFWTLIAPLCCPDRDFD